jgi:hypothetical protein
MARVLERQLAEHHLRRRRQDEPDGQGDTPKRLGSGRPIIPITGSSARPNVGWAMKPTASEVTVMPSCAPDSMNSQGVAVWRGG